MRAGERCELVQLEKIKHALSEKICDYADVVAEVETVAKMDTFVAIEFVVAGERGKHSQLYPRGVSIFGNGTDDLDGTSSAFTLIESLDNFAKGTLTQEFHNLICLGLAESQEA